MYDDVILRPKVIYLCTYCLFICSVWDTFDMCDKRRLMWLLRALIVYFVISWVFRQFKAIFDAKITLHGK